MAKLLLLNIIAFIPSKIAAYNFDYEYEGTTLHYSFSDNYIEYPFAYVTGVLDRSVTEVSIPANVNVGGLDYTVVSINEKAFRDCNNLTSITLPNSAITIENQAFYNCSGLPSIELPDKIRRIGDNAFTGCSMLSELTVLSEVPPTISGNSFPAQMYANATVKVNDEYIINYLNSTDWSVFEKICGMRDSNVGTLFSDDVLNYCLTSENTAAVMAGDYSSMTTVTIPSRTEYNGKLISITSIADNAFKDCAKIRAISLPKKLESIGENAFANCSNLSELTLPATLKEIGKSAFANCSSIRAVEIPSSVTLIGTSAFSDCYALTNFKVLDGDSEIVIGENALENVKSLKMYLGRKWTVKSNDSYPKVGLVCIAPMVQSIEIGNNFTEIAELGGLKNLTYVSIPNSVTTIADGTFVNCTQLGSIDIPGSVTTIGEGTFKNCSSLTNITLPASVSEIRSSTFEGCTSLEEVIMSDGISSIGSRAFYGCSVLAKIQLPDSLTELGDRVFYDCPALTEIVIPDSVSNLGSYSFYGCSNLRSISLSKSMNEIGEYTFYNCHNLRSIVIPNSVNTIGEYAFASCTYLFDFHVEDGENPLEFKRSALNKANVRNLYMGRNWSYYTNIAITTGITDVTIGDMVTKIPDYAFHNCENLKNYNIPNSVTAIGDYAFYRCASIKGNLIIPNSVTTIGSSAFYLCFNLTDLTLPNSLTTIKNGAFCECTGLTYVKLPDSLTEIADGIFSKCSNLRGVEIPNSVTSIGDSSFNNCRALKSIGIPNTVTSIDNSAFYNCDLLTEVVLPEALTIIGNEAFGNCDILEKVTMHNSLTSIGNQAFVTCPKLTSINIPGSVTTIGEEAFMSCKGLKEIVFEDGYAELNIGSNLFYNAPIRSLYLGRDIIYSGTDKWYESLRSLVIGNTVTTIKDSQFKDGSLSSVKFGGSLNSIGANAFSGCYISSPIVLPPNIETIGAEAFANNSITDITIGPKVKEIGERAFDSKSIISNVTITAVMPPAAQNTTFSYYDGDFNVMPGMVDIYYDTTPCWYRFENGKELSVADNLVISYDEFSELNPGDTVQLTAELTPGDVSLPHIFWRSTNPAIATVDHNGLVTFHGDNTSATYASVAECKIIAETLYANGPIAEVRVSGTGLSDVIDESITIDSVESERPDDIYNLQGVCIKRNASQDDIEALQPGLYIIAGKKVLVK